MAGVPPSQRPVQRRQGERPFQRPIQVPPSHAASEHVQQHRQVHELGSHADVGDVRDPDLVRVRHGQVGHEIGVTREGVVAVRCPHPAGRRFGGETQLVKGRSKPVLPRIW